MTYNKLKLKLSLIISIAYLFIYSPCYSNYDISIIHPTIANNDGKIFVTLYDAAPYKVYISPLPALNSNKDDWYASSAGFQFLREGTYTITITDKIGCVYEETVTLTKMTCPVSINLIDLQHNSSDQIYYPDGRIEIEVGPNIDLADYNIFWKNSEGVIIRQDQLFLDYVAAAKYTVDVVHKTASDCKAQREFEITECRSTYFLTNDDCYDPPCTEVESINTEPTMRLEVTNIIGPTSTTSTDGEIQYVLTSVGGETFINWFSLNPEARVTENSINNVKGGTYCYEISNGCGKVHKDCLEIVACSRNLNLIGEIQSVTSPQCEGMDYSIRYRIKYTNPSIRLSQVKIMLSENEEVQTFNLVNQNFIDFFELSLGGTYQVLFEDNCGRVFEDEFSVIDAIENYTSPCNPFEKSFCGAYISNGTILFSTECKTGDCPNYVGDFPFGYPNFGLDNPEIHLHTDFEDWNYCEVKIIWGSTNSREETIFLRQDDGSYKRTGPKSVNVGVGEYETIVSINGGECVQVFTTDFGYNRVFGQNRGNTSFWGSIVYGSWRVETTMDDDLIPLQPATSPYDINCREVDYDTRFIFVPNNPQSSNPCQDGGYWFEWDFGQGKQFRSGGIIEPNGFSTTHFINSNFDHFPYCEDSGQIHACVFLNESIPGIPNLPGENVFMYFCDNPKQVLSCEPITKRETEPGSCLFDTVCQDGSLATISGFTITSQPIGTACFVKVETGETDCDDCVIIVDQVEFCNESCAIIEKTRTFLEFDESQHVLCRDLFTDCPTDSFLNF